VIGHQWAIDLLQKHIQTEQMRHAYLLLGPESLGKTTLALRFAQALNCLQPVFHDEPCGHCIPCRQIEDGNFPDVRLIRPETTSEEVKVDEVRDLSRWLALSPYQSKWRIAILADFHQANEHAANALLKTLEEPGGNALLLLTAHSAEDLLPTIVSRCEVLKLRPVPVDELCQSLLERGLDEEDVRLYARISGGFPGKAITLLEDSEAAEHRKQRLEEHALLLTSNRAERSDYASKMSRFHKEAWVVRGEVLETLAYWQLLWRDVMLINSGANVAIQNQDLREIIDQLTLQVSVTDTLSILKKIHQTGDAVQRNANIRLALESLLLTLPYLQV